MQEGGNHTDDISKASRQKFVIETQPPGRGCLFTGATTEAKQPDFVLVVLCMIHAVLMGLLAFDKGQARFSRRRRTQ